MNDKFKRIVISGKGGSGKDHLVKILKKDGYTYSVSHTSRPKRDCEIEGVDYYFIDKEVALEMAKNSEFYEYVEFNGWFYGTSNTEFQRANLFIMTPSGIEKLRPSDRAESLIIFLDIQEDVLLERLSKRNDADDAGRRLESDRKDFKNFFDFDVRITNPNFTKEDIQDALDPEHRNIFDRMLYNIKKKKDD